MELALNGIFLKAFSPVILQMTSRYRAAICEKGHFREIYDQLSEKNTFSLPAHLYPQGQDKVNL